MFSIIIPTLNNLKYLKFCIESIEKNSKFNHTEPFKGLFTQGMVCHQTFKNKNNF